MDLQRELMPIKFLVWRDNSINKFIGDYITNEIKIIDDIFFDDKFPFVFPLIILFSMKYVFKYQQNISSLIYNFMVVSFFCDDS